MKQSLLHDMTTAVAAADLEGMHQMTSTCLSLLMRDVHMSEMMTLSPSYQVLSIVSHQLHRKPSYIATSELPVFLVRPSLGIPMLLHLLSYNGAFVLVVRPPSLQTADYGRLDDS